MSKLTQGDIADLTTFFASPLTAAVGFEIGAQTYEPRGKQGYDPTTDTKLAGLVFRGIQNGKNDWARMKRVIDQLSEAVVEVLRVVCEGGAEAVGCRMSRARMAGRQLFDERARMSYLETIRRLGIKHFHDSPIAMASRVLEADRQFVPPAPSVRELTFCARDAIEQGLVDVAGEVEAMLDAVGAAYHAGCTQVAAARRAHEAKEDQRRAEFRAELSARQAAKQHKRFDRALRSAS